ncbi:MAG: thiamine pyrophosphate-dependent dehydrogenase E1 component subunit alpha, partial [SAR202 cluster bacterium]|nr:thiamine pyrophosphate-dependent dehydrogenase E1 component subunit alpha [SAR202 cluster bacterium]
PAGRFLCQILGNQGDYLKGRQMPDHFGSAEVRFAVASSPVGTQIPHAVGAGVALRLRGEPAVATVYFGDGATSTGDFHAGLTFAAVQQAPVVFFCKNNGWAISLPTARQCRAERIADKAPGYGLPGITVDGNDLLAVYEVSRHALDWARTGHGPVLLEFLTQRMGPHSTADDVTRYRPTELLEPWKKRDPLERMRLYLVGRGVWSDAEEARCRQETEAWFQEAFDWAAAQPQPQPASMFEDVYAELPWHLREQQEEALACRS